MDAGAPTALEKACFPPSLPCGGFALGQGFVLERSPS